MAMSYAESATRSSTHIASLANSLMENEFLRGLGDSLIGVDRRRHLPKIAPKSYARMVKERSSGGKSSKQKSPAQGKVQRKTRESLSSTTFTPTTTNRNWPWTWSR